MPELPEVEFGRRLADRAARDRTIDGVWTADDDIVFEDGRRRDVERALKGARIRAVRRRGKHLWFELDRRPWPLFHFGMTGAFRVRDQAPLELASSPAQEPQGWPPRFAKIRMQLSGDAELVMTNARRLGRIRLRRVPEAEPPIADLGWDPLVDTFRAPEVKKRLVRRNGPIKVALMDQSLFAGVGNWIADEVLFQAALAPERAASSLEPREVSVLCGSLRRIVRTAVDADADKSRYPNTWLFHRRWGKRPLADPVTARGEPIAFTTVGGRRTAWVPSRQR